MQIWFLSANVPSAEQLAQELRQRGRAPGKLSRSERTSALPNAVLRFECEIERVSLLSPRRAAYPHPAPTTPPGSCFGRERVRICPVLWENSMGIVFFIILTIVLIIVTILMVLVRRYPTPGVQYSIRPTVLFIAVV
jgi:hypothetical protein